MLKSESALLIHSFRLCFGLQPLYTTVVIVLPLANTWSRFCCSRFLLHDSHKSSIASGHIFTNKVGGQVQLNSEQNGQIQQ
jgi:hypothetical protein